ncbi:hypothetical protein D9758_016788 [Tetrapyrgos nigripes]|uniref:Xylanolytic transcriptional activator regulatory domain-containing protein n=2 Tax=Tetrapyrgos nigripes TaxID=182062 RepID=A0A8H5BIJ9_9AGAR|nr:hypothetical protein D9758_016788 [Tetrapyrgos nigripes]
MLAMNVGVEKYDVGITQARSGSLGNVHLDLLSGDSAAMPGGICSSCISLRFTCTHLAEKKKRGPKTNTQANFTAVKAIVSSVLSDDSNTFIIPENEDSVREILVEIASYVRHLEKELVRAHRQESLVQYQSSPMVEGDSPSQTGPSPSTEDDDSDYSDGELLSQDMANVRISRLENRHFGRSSSVFLVASTLELLKHGPAFDKRSEYWVLSPVSLIPLLYDLIRWTPIVGIKYERTRVEEEPMLQFPDNDHLQSLLEAYFTFHHPYQPLLHQASFERSVAEGLHLRDHQFGALLLAVCSMASKYSDDPRNLPKDSSAVLALGWRWFQQLKLTTSTFAEPVSLYELQTYCLQIHFLQTSYQSETAWILAGLCIRFAHERGLHRRRDPLEKPTLERELWKRAFWFLMCVDTVMGTSLGRPSATSKDDYDLEPLIECDDSAWDNPFIDVSALAPSKTSSSAYWNCLIQLIEILSFTQRTLYSIRKSELVETMGISDTQWTDNAIRQIDSALNNWSDALPGHLKWDPHGPNNIHLVQSATLHAVYYWIQMHAHRFFIPMLNRGGPVVIKSPSVAICMNAGRSCVNILDALFKRHRYLTPPLPPALFNASVISLICLCRTKELQLQLDRQKEILNIYKCLEILRELEKRMKSAGRFSDLTQGVVSSGGLQLPFQEPQEPLKRKRETGLEEFFDVNAAGQHPNPQLSPSAINIRTFPDEIGSAHEGPTHVHAQGKFLDVLGPVYGLQSVAYDSPNPMRSNPSFGSSIPYSPLVDSTRSTTAYAFWKLQVNTWTDRSHAKAYYDPGFTKAEVHRIVNALQLPETIICPENQITENRITALCMLFCRDHMDQRLVGLVSKLSDDKTKLTVTGPPSATIYSPAYVFVLADGIPSFGSKTLIGTGAQPPLDEDALANVLSSLPFYWDKWTAAHPGEPVPAPSAISTSTQFLGGCFLSLVSM